MFASLVRNPGRGRSMQPLSRSTRLGFEALEERSVPSASRIAIVEAPTLASDWPPPPGRPAQVSRMTVDAGRIEVLLSRGSLEEIPSFCGQNAGQIELLGRRDAQAERSANRHGGEEIPQLGRHGGEEIPQFSRHAAQMEPRTNRHGGEEIPQLGRHDTLQVELTTNRHGGEEIPQ